ncbi:anthranilate synthase [Bdellovibrio bacteriovorus]|uniref:Anthranilate synthase n=1 Tax=Bdellovibrio bacteriovorus TaxID=959 RepID=A0A150WR62_BDEBC|nr:gamma-glutamyl-gamma-aminobutyrate hydrolase family protein [Bdellovibrio bacteriovorus]KYG66910.1 anthranilate synthase [Bdellovibrio bacteriovorus]
MDSERPLLIGISARILYDPPEGFEIKKKTVQYLEDSLAHLVTKRGGLIFMVPSLEMHSRLEKKDLDVHQYADVLDGLVLQGGVDISPTTYGEEPIEVMKDHRTDPIRDRYELKLLKAFVQKKKPVLGICRGFQLMNVFKGGTLFQDLPTQHEHGVAHRSDSYDAFTHAVKVVNGGMMDKMYERKFGEIVSIHHQGVNKLGTGLQIEAVSDDGLVEAFSSTEEDFYFGVQWHPEFHADEEERFLSAEPLMKAFLKACKKAKEATPIQEPPLNP